MSTTVIASRHGTALYLLPSASPPLDVDTVRVVLARHGVTLVPGTDLALAHEFIAAQGLDPLQAAALAEDLRGVGLTVRVLNRTGLTTSRRVGSAFATQFSVSMVGLMTTVTAAGALSKGDLAGLALPLLVAGAALLLATAWNALNLQRHGGAVLRVGGTDAVPVPRAALLTERLSGLLDGLPSHLAEPLLARARRLEDHARTEPQGSAAQELRALVEDLERTSDDDAATEARQLRDDVARARQALRETQGR